MITSRVIRDIEYVLLDGKDSQRKTTDIVIERNGIITVRPPADYSPEMVDAVVNSKRMWIYRNLAEWKDLNANTVNREWVNGETFLYLGRAYRLSLISDQQDALLLKDGRFCLSRDLIELGGVDAAKRAFEQYFMAKGLEHFTNRVKYYSPKVGVTPSDIRIRDMGFRWATCGANGVLSFHWKSMMAPPQIIDYIVVHELCHMRHANHTDAFWNEVDKVMPNFYDRKEWLRQFGASLTI